MKKLIVIFISIFTLLSVTANAQNAGGAAQDKVPTYATNNGYATTYDPVVVKNYMPAPVVKVTNPDVRVPVNITIEYPPAPQAPVKDYDYISPYMVFIVILLAGLCVVIGFLFGRNGRGNGSGPVTIHNHGGTGGSGGVGGAASVETHESTTITGPTK